MKKILTFIFIGSIAFNAFSQKKQKEELKTNLDSVSYCLGTYFGNSLKAAGVSAINNEAFIKGLEAELSGTSKISQEVANQLIQAFMMKQFQAKTQKNLAEGRKFLEENKKKEGVITLPSGLQYKVIANGEEESPTINDKVTCHYEGKLINGKVFDSSIQRGKPMQFAVNGVISGWTEALQLMKPGAKWILYIPSELAYGEQIMRGSEIEPNSVLIFDIELISVEKQTPAENK